MWQLLLRALRTAVLSHALQAKLSVPASRLAQEAAGEGFGQPGLVGPRQSHSALSASCLIPAPLVRTSSSSRDGRDLFGPAASLAADSVAAAAASGTASGGQQYARVVYDSGLEQASLTEVSCLCWIILQPTAVAEQVKLTGCMGAFAGCSIWAVAQF